MSLEVLSLIVFAIGTGVALLTGERIITIVAGVAGVLYGLIVLIHNVN